MMRNRRAGSLLALALMVGLGAAAFPRPGLDPAEAQGQRVVVYGRVAWVAGLRMVVVADNGVSVTIDLRRADQRSYGSLRGGDRVVVTGVVAPERDRLIAEDIQADASGYSPHDYWNTFQQAP